MDKSATQTQAPQTPKAAPRPTHGLVAVAVPSDRIVRPVFARHGFHNGALLMDWPAIVGSAVASHSLPVSIRFPRGERTEGTVVIKVAPGGFALEILHWEPLILEKINGYYGWKAVSRLKLIQGPLPDLRRNARQVRAEGQGGSGPLPAATALASVEDPDLRRALERLGSALTKS